VRFALGAYVCGHFPLIAGAVIAAAATAGALQLADSDESTGVFYGLCLTGG
jgi:hypothetical protein